jgi:1-acyl-sn-glycerol-3-phosphate acyltransferase
LVVFRLLYKVIGFLLLFFALLSAALSLAFYAFIFRLPAKQKRKYQLAINRFINVLVLKLLSIKVTLKNFPHDQKHYLIVANHTGFLDIFAMNVFCNGLFITSVEMQQTPVLGWVTDAGGCLYVERRDRSNIDKEVLKIRQALEDGHNVILYPEGTSTDGAQVLPFKRTLITAASGVVPIQPIVINYDKVNDEPMSHKYRKHVFWYGKNHFLPSILRLFSIKSCEISITYLEPVFIHSSAQKHETSVVLHQMVSAAFKKIEYPPGVSSDFEVPKYIKGS